MCLGEHTNSGVAFFAHISQGARAHPGALQELLLCGAWAEHQACGVQLISLFKALWRGLLRGSLPSANKSEAPSPGTEPSASGSSGCTWG